MFNLLRMDFYRLLKSKSVYICLGFLLAASLLCFWVVWLMATPEGQEAAVRIGATALADSSEYGSIIEDYNILMMFREIGMDGGAYAFFLGIVTVLFVCADYSSGFIKNIMSLHRDRWKYYASKLITVGVLNFCYLWLTFSFCLLLNVLFGNLTPPAAAADILIYMGQAWLVTTAMSAMFILVCFLTRSNSAGIVAAMLVGSGILVTFVGYVTGLFNASGWFPYTLYYNLTYAPFDYIGMADMKGHLIGLAFLVLYSAAAVAVLRKRDI